jgi:SHS2 domain-containing protein
MGEAVVFEHTADLGLRIVGRDLADLFESAARGLIAVIVADPTTIEPRLEESVKLADQSLEGLMAKWLNELIFRVETRRHVYASFQVEVKTSPDESTLEGRIAGEPIDRSRHQMDHEVKAATRHQLVVERTADGWTAEIIVDI